MRVVVAPDKCKGSLTAAQVAARVAAGLAPAEGPTGVAVDTASSYGTGQVTGAGPLLERLAANIARDWITDDQRETSSQ
jgi:hypothetical protein